VFYVVLVRRHSRDKRGEFALCGIGSVEEVVERTKRLQIEVGVDAAKVVQVGIAGHVGAEDLLGQGGIGRQQVSVEASDELQIVGVGPIAPT
jgi:hypothetical protein